MKYDIKPQVKGLIFDLDGTLVDSMPLHLEGWKRACERFGAKFDTAYLRQNTGTPGWLIAEMVIKNSGLNGNVSPEEILKAKFDEFDKVNHLVRPIVPVLQIVKKYHNILPMAIGTGGHRETVEKTLNVTGLRDYFQVVVTANDVQNYKPHPETFLRCSELMGVIPESIEVFEDGDLGITAAKSAGMIATDVRGWYQSEW